MQILVSKLTSLSDFNEEGFDDVDELKAEYGHP
jgi:hypothetical protein